MAEHRTRNRPVMVIDHEPLKTVSAENHHNDQAPRAVFGKRQKSNAKPTVTRDFFSSPPNSRFKANSHDYDKDDTEDDGFKFSQILSDLPLKTLAAVFMIAIALPMAFIAISERRTLDNIDPITTASVTTSNGLEISDVSMTRIQHLDSSVATVFGKLSNPQTSDKPLRPLVITLYDKAGNEVQRWQHRIGRTQIQPNQNYRFMTSAIDYSGKARTVRVTLAK